MNEKNVQVLLARRPKEAAQESDFHIVETAVPGIPRLDALATGARLRLTTADTLVINRTVGSSTNENTIKFNGDSSLTLTSGTNPPRQLTKR